MQIDTKTYGIITIEQQQSIQFPIGIYGFEHLHDWALHDAHRPPFYCLQSLEDRSVSFVIINPYLFRPDYLLNIPDADFDLLGGPESDAILVFAIVTIPEHAEQITANLLGPIIINRERRLGIQSISQDLRWKTKHAIVTEIKEYVSTHAAS